MPQLPKEHTSVFVGLQFTETGEWFTDVSHSKPFFPRSRASDTFLAWLWWSEWHRLSHALSVGGRLSSNKTSLVKTGGSRQRVGRSWNWGEGAKLRFAGTADAGPRSATGAKAPHDEPGQAHPPQWEHLQTFKRLPYKKPIGRVTFPDSLPFPVWPRDPSANLECSVPCPTCGSLVSAVQLKGEILFKLPRGAHLPRWVQLFSSDFAGFVGCNND